MMKSAKSAKSQSKNSPTTKSQVKKPSSKSRTVKEEPNTEFPETKEVSKKPLKRGGSAKSKQNHNSLPRGGQVKSDLIPSMTFAATSYVPGKASEPGMPFRLERLITPVEVGLEYAARRKELDADFEKARRVLEKYRPKLEKRKDFVDGHITGTSVRFRTKFGQVVSPLQVAIVINVDRKRSLDDLKKRGYEKFDELDGVPVKVVEGSFSLISESASFLRGLASPITPVSFSDPIVGGAAISPPGNPSAFGTLGLVAVSDNNQQFGISCQHVVSNSVDQIAANGKSRSVGAIKTSRPPDKDFKKGTITESLDCSLIAFVKNPSVPIKFPGGGNWVHGFSSDIYLAARRVNSSELDRPIFKFGVGSGELVEGRIEALDRDININGVPYFNNYSVVLAEDSGRTFAVPGDSGSVLLVDAVVNSKPAMVVIGILFARLNGDNAVKVGIACNMSFVLHALKLDKEISGLKIAKTWTYA